MAAEDDNMMDNREDVQPAPLPKELSIAQYVLFKIDRTLAIAGIITIAVTSLIFVKEVQDSPIALAALGALGVYIGGRGGKG